MADPIQLPNSTPKDISTAKVTRTARQKFENRQKRQPEKRDVPHPAAKGREKSAGTPDHNQGNVIDIRI